MVDYVDQFVGMEHLEDVAVHAAVTRAVLKQFELLPRRARPDPGQWTNVAGIVLVNVDVEGGGVEDVVQSAVCVCLATGTKCLPADRWREDGKAVTDCHAEVLCRRLFQLWLAREIEEEMSILNNTNATRQHSKFIQRVIETDATAPERPVFKMRSGWRICMYTSMSPCGDASILQSFDQQESLDQQATNRQSSEGDEADAGIERPRKFSKVLDKAVPGRTGARRIEQIVPDKLESDQTPGCLRLKPGRGVSCKSLSCSDKMAVWNVVGLQGWLLAPLLQSPVFLDLLVVDRAFFDKRALRRALKDRIGEHCRNFSQLHVPSTEGLLFQHGRATVPLKAPATNRSANWILGMGDEYLLGDLGRRDGIPAKRSWEEKYASRVSRWSFFNIGRKFAAAVTQNSNINTFCPDFTETEKFDTSYKRLKSLCIAIATPEIKDGFQEKSRLMKSYFSSWSEMKQSSSTAEG
jgi:hypothetical protein